MCTNTVSLDNWGVINVFWINRGRGKCLDFHGSLIFNIKCNIKILNRLELITNNLIYLILLQIFSLYTLSQNNNKYIKVFNVSLFYELLT